MIQEDRTYFKKRKPKIETFGYASPIKNRLINESLIDDLQKKRASLFKGQHKLSLGENNVLGLKMSEMNSSADMISENPELKAPMTLTQSRNVILSTKRSKSTAKTNTKSAFKRKPLPGKYSFSRVKTDDFKTMNHE